MGPSIQGCPLTTTQAMLQHWCQLPPHMDHLPYPTIKGRGTQIFLGKFTKGGVTVHPYTPATPLTPLFYTTTPTVPSLVSTSVLLV